MTTNESLKEVWLLTSYHEGVTVEERLFAELGDKEIKSIASDIANAFNGFGFLISAYVESEIRKNLAAGETEIRISSGDYASSEFIIVKTDIDSGYDWAGCDDCEVDESLCKEVHKGDEVYVTLGYYDNAQAVYSAEMPEMGDYMMLTIE